jgi:hypothetical protein
MEFIPFIVGVVLGTILTVLLWCTKKPSGTLRIDRSNPEKDIYRFDIDNFDSLAKQKEIVLKVDNNADLSQK